MMLKHFVNLGPDKSRGKFSTLMTPCFLDLPKRSPGRGHCLHFDPTPREVRIRSLVKEGRERSLLSP